MVMVPVLKQDEILAGALDTASTEDELESFAQARDMPVVVVTGSSIEDALLKAVETIQGKERPGSRTMSGVLEGSRSVDPHIVTVEAPVLVAPELRTGSLGTEPQGPGLETRLVVGVLEAGRELGEEAEVPRPDGFVDTESDTGSGGELGRGEDGSEASFTEQEEAFFSGYEPDEPLDFEDILALVNPGAAARRRARIRARSRGRLGGFFSFFLG